MTYIQHEMRWHGMTHRDNRKLYERRRHVIAVVLICYPIAILGGFLNFVIMQMTDFNDSFIYYIDEKSLFFQ